MMGVRVTTDRLELIAGTVALARAEVCYRLEFSRLLDANVPGHWPPPLENADTVALNLQRLEEAPNEIGWWTWYLVLREDASSARFLVGVAGFRGKPTSDGTVEIGYSVLQRVQGFGYATEAVKGLLSWAFEHAEVSRVTALTLPELTPSIRVLEKSGFVTVGEGPEEGLIRFELSRSAYEMA
jgi:RimJ/RimL family protein N-acetyltransferase